MRAILCHAYGSPGTVLQHANIPTPSPAPVEVLIRVRAAGVNPLDWHLVRGLPLPIRIVSGLSKPTRPEVGVDVAGEVEAVGAGVTRFKRGDEVFGACRGAFAEYACAAESSLALKPGNVTFEQAASVPVAAVTALQGLRDVGRMHAGQHVLINGAAGGVGTFAIQIAKAYGAHVTAVCSGKNVDLVRSLGADRVIDYTVEDFTAGSDRYDVILDCVGTRPLSARGRVLARGGTCAIAGGSSNAWVLIARTLGGMILSHTTGPRFATFVAKVNETDLATLRDLLAAGTLTPVIDRRYPLSEVPAAVGYVEQGHARGKVVVTVAP